MPNGRPSVGMAARFALRGSIRQEGAVKSLIVLCAAFALVATGARAAAEPEKAPAILAEQDRSVVGGRAVRLALAQTQIETTIELGRVANTSAYGGGLLGVLIIESTDDRRAIMRGSLRDKAEATVAPLRRALQDFDVGALAFTTTQAALARHDWFQARGITASSATPAQNVAATDAPQSAVVTYRYELSPDFSHIRVLAEITITRNAASRSGRTAASPKVIYRQRICSVVQLGTRSYEPHENVARWSADNGRLARQALTAAFGQVEQLIPYALGLSQADFNSLTAKNREKAFGAGFYGPLIARTGNDVLIWADGFLHVQTLA